MLNTLHELWNDEDGFLISMELILIATILVLGLIVGMSCLANAVVAEFQDLGFAVRSLNQSYYFGGFRGCKSWVPGSAFTNRPGLNSFPGVGVTDMGLDIGIGGANYGPGYAAPGYVAPAVVVPGPVLAPSTKVVPCPTGNCPPETVAPCNTPDCTTGTVVPGTRLLPVPDNALPKLTPIPNSPKLEAPFPNPPATN